MLAQVRGAKLPEPVLQHRLYPRAVLPGRKRLTPFRFDLAWEDRRLAVEIQGGSRLRGPRNYHGSGDGLLRDCEKLNEATLQGWRVLKFVGEQVEDGRALDVLREALEHQTAHACPDRGACVHH